MPFIGNLCYIFCTHKILCLKISYVAICTCAGGSLSTKLAFWKVPFSNHETFFQAIRYTYLLTFVIKLTFAPDEINISTSSVWPTCAVRWSGESTFYVICIRIRNMHLHATSQLAINGYVHEYILYMWLATYILATTMYIHSYISENSAIMIIKW